MNGFLRPPLLKPLPLLNTPHAIDAASNGTGGEAISAADDESLDDITSGRDGKKNGGDLASENNNYDHAMQSQLDRQRTRRVPKLVPREPSTSNRVSQKWVKHLQKIGVGSKQSLARYKLQSIHYYGEIKESSGAYLSSDNPCMVHCTLSLIDSKQNSRKKSKLHIKSDLCTTKDGALFDAIYKLEARIAGDNNHAQRTSKSVYEKDSIINCNQKNIKFRSALPHWATSRIESNFYLYELDFLAQQEANTGQASCSSSSGSIVHFSQVMGIDDSVATRIGVIFGSDLLHGYEFNGSEISSDFVLFQQQTKTGRASKGNSKDHQCLRMQVRVCNKSKMNLVDMSEQVNNSANPKIQLKKGETPIALLKCFNHILFEGGGTTHGIKSSGSWKKILNRMDNSVQSNITDRTYLFVPLMRNKSPQQQNLKIDWSTVWEVVHNKPSPIIRRFDSEVCLPYSFFSLMSFLLFLVVIMACTPAISIISTICFESITLLILDWDWGHFIQQIDYKHTIDTATNFFAVIGPTESKVVAICLLVIGILMTIDFASVPKKASLQLLHNRFLLQPTKAKNITLFVTAKEKSVQPITSYSSLPKNSNQLKTQINNYDRPTKFKGVTYATYYELKRGFPLRYPLEPLIAISPLQTNECNNFLRGRCPDRTDSYLIPELSLILPMPRDMQYLCQHAFVFMPQLERAALLFVAASRLNSFKWRESEHLNLKETHYVHMSNQMRLIDQITKHSQHRERYEILGDSVLLFYNILNLFAKNPTNSGLCGRENFEMLIGGQGSNETLFRASMSIGLHRLLNLGNSSTAVPWRSLYAIKTTGGKKKQKGKKSQLSTPPPLPYGETTAHKRLSDLFESLLGACYALDRSGCMAIGLLNEANSCFHCSQDSGKAWFAGKGTCMSLGYPFDFDGKWILELERIRSVLDVNPCIKSTLETNCDGICRFLSVSSLWSQPTSKTLIQSALFDDSLDDEYIRSNADGLQSIAILRDKLFQIGNAALQLKIVEEYFNRHRYATPGDISLARSALLSHDSLAYIFVKNGLHEFLYDKRSFAISTFQSIMASSDSLGAAEWAKRGGWILRGGVREFRRRIRESGHMDFEPRYSGLAAGSVKFCKDRLPEEVTDEIPFSFKSITGALVLSLGLENTWNVLKLFFLEVLVLSPDEIRLIRSFKR